VKNVTVSVPDEVYRAARIHAAQHGTSVSRLVADFFWQLSSKDAEYARLKKVQDDVFTRIDAAGKGLRAADRLSRDEAHERGVR